MESGSFPHDRYECSQALNCEIPAQFEAAIANDLVATEDLACCLHGKDSRPEGPRLMACTAIPAGVSTTVQFTES